MKELEKQNPKDLARRCCGEIVALWQQLELTTGLLEAAAKRSDVMEAVRLVEYYYEDAMARVFNLRERIWDCLAVIVDIPRPDHWTERLRERVRRALEADYPIIKQAFDTFLAMADVELHYRRLATHERLFFLGISFDQDHDAFYEIDGVLLSHAPESSEGKEIRVMTIKALRSFARQKAQEIDSIARQAIEVERLCSDAIQKKSWLTGAAR
jgi:hypothetical protein